MNHNNHDSSGNLRQAGETSSTAADSTGQRASGLLKKSLASLLKSIPTLLVFAALGGVAYWGHQHGWTLPKISQLSGKDSSGEGLWCDEHGVPEAECVACNADLLPKDRLFGWCKTHGVHECVLEHPQLAQLEQVPVISQLDLDVASRAISARPRTKNDSLCKKHLRRIQFPSIDAVNRAGIDIDLVDRGRVVETIKATGEVIYDPTLVAQLASRAAGTVWHVEQNIGDRVEQGDLLALVDAEEVGQAKSQLLTAIVKLRFDRIKLARLQKAMDAIARKDIDSAEAEIAATEVLVHKSIQTLSNLGLSIELDELAGQSTDQIRERIQFLGIPEPYCEKLNSATGSFNLAPILAPRNGILVWRDCVAGEVIGRDKKIFMIADTGRMWLMLNLKLEEMDRVAVGQKVVFRADGSATDMIGRISWISTESNPKTRTVQVRAELDNPTGRLRNETFGSGKIVLREEPNSILVPAEAIHWEGCCHIAFVRDRKYFEDGSYKLFHTRSVRPGAQVGNKIEVIAGLLRGEVVVTKGSGVLRAELLKGNLGAG